MAEMLDLNDPETPHLRRAPTRLTRISEWPVPRKVALVLAIPLLLALALGGLRVQSELATAAAANATASQVTVLGPAVGYLTAAENAALVFRSSGDDERRDAALTQVNQAAATLERAWSAADLSEAQRQQVRALLDQTRGLRDGSAYRVLSTTSRQLQTLESAVTVGIAEMADAGAQPESLISLVGHVNAGRLALTQQQLLVDPEPEVIPTEELSAFLGMESAAIGSLELQLPDDARVELLRQYNSSNTGILDIGTAVPQGEAPLALYDELATDLLGQIESVLNSQAAASHRTALITALLVALALLIAVALALVVARLLVRPIRQVRDGALAIAHAELPETVRRIRAGEDPGEVSTIAVTTHEEMGQLARAVDDLHGTAVHLARGEAELRARVSDMFVTLSRRNTSLVNQQLHLIDQLERDEEDPQRLESLFRLDHLASRMRRTAESLVVLADAPSQAGRADALLVDEALQAATAGVQDYARVQVAGVPALRITGAAAPDVVHLFTELIDNALAFSAPGTPVTVSATTPAGLLCVEVADAGLGIDPGRLAELNQTLRTGAEVTADTARRMGLFVVARLARRHGLTVTLEHNAEGGITAQVFLPRTLLTEAGSDPLVVAEYAEAPVEPPREAALGPASVPAGSLFQRPEPVETDLMPAPAEPAPAAPAAAAAVPSLDVLSAVINANIGLPQRRPGTSPQPEQLTPVLPHRSRVVPDSDPAPEVAEPVEVSEPAAHGSEPIEPAPEPEPEPREQPASASPDPLADPLAGPVAYDDDEEETPLFRMLRSSWFAGPGEADQAAGWGTGEADAGWQAAGHAAGAAPSRLTPSGLPVRDPGHQLVPGGVAQAAPSLQRDPEAIRARLSAHAAGVARGRSLAATLPDRPVETTEDVR